MSYELQTYVGRFGELVNGESAMKTEWLEIISVSLSYT